VKVAAIVSTSGTKESDVDSVGSRSRILGGLLATNSQAELHILGRTLLDRTLDSFKRLGVDRPTVVPVGPGLIELTGSLSSLPRRSFFAWEGAIDRLIADGAERIILTAADIYTDLDYRELLRFHSERGAACTQVYSATKPLNIAVVETDALRCGTGPYKTRIASLMGTHERFCFDGYAIRLRKPTDFVQLVSDALYRRCALQPEGAELFPGVWLATGAEVDSSCVITGPAFIGAEASVAAGCTITGGTAIEHGCKIDCGTTVEQSWILPGTYVGLGLRVSRSIVSNKKMFHLDRKTEITVTDRRLIGAMRSPFLGMSDRASEGTQAVNET
jgi:hypothetical protein